MCDGASHHLGPVVARCAAARAWHSLHGPSLREAGAAPASRGPIRRLCALAAGTATRWIIREAAGILERTAFSRARYLGPALGPPPSSAGHVSRRSSVVLCFRKHLFQVE